MPTKIGTATGRESAQISVGAVAVKGTGVVQRGISIHALREEGDYVPGSLPLGHGDFYPRPPRGGRPMLFILSAGQKISIHALREEGDPSTRPAGAA